MIRPRRPQVPRALIWKMEQRVPQQSYFPPRLREYRYIERDNRTYVIEPRGRTIIEEIDWR
jgi:hypothetical protein